MADRLSARRVRSRLRLASPVSASRLACWASFAAEASRSSARDTRSRQRRKAVRALSSSVLASPNTSNAPTVFVVAAWKVRLQAGVPETSACGGCVTDRVPR